MEPQKLIGLRVRGMRGAQTQQQIAQRMEYFGYEVSQSAIARIESGDRKITVEEFLVLAAALNTTPVELLTPDEGNVLDIGRVSLEAGSTRRWLTGEDPDALRSAAVRREALGLARQSGGSVDTEWADRVAEEVLADPGLVNEFHKATGEPLKSRVMRLHLVMSTAAYRITERQRQEGGEL